MKFRIDSAIDNFLVVMLFVKFVFLISSVGHVATVRSSNPNITKHELLLRRISETSEMIFVIGMSLFLIYHFRPNKKSYVIGFEAALLLFAYGIVMLFGAFKKYHIKTPIDRLKKEDDSEKNTEEPPSTNPPTPPTSSSQFSPFYSEKKSTTDK
jgi:hypothetical protein